MMCGQPSSALQHSCLQARTVKSPARAPEHAKTSKTPKQHSHPEHALSPDARGTAGARACIAAMELSRQGQRRACRAHRHLWLLQPGLRWGLLLRCPLRAIIERTRKQECHLASRPARHRGPSNALAQRLAAAVDLVLCTVKNSHLALSGSRTSERQNKHGVITGRSIRSPDRRCL